MSKKKTTEQFIEEAKAVHGDKYIYDEAVYEGKDKKVKIICPTHGEFFQTPHNHVYFKQGCPKCEYEKMSKDKIKDKEWFLEKAKEVHGDKYDYSKSVYNGYNTEMIITCPTHGDFAQTPHVHLSGHGCPKCIKNRKLDTKSFIEICSDVHKGKYDYSKSVFKDSHSKLTIICPIHGNFEQVAYYHIQGHGCPMCNSSHLENDIRNLLTENGIEFISQCNSKTFEWLKRQTLDFYLPKYNIAIECQGRQHYVVVEHFSDGLDKIIERDERKFNLCKEHEVPIFYFADEEFVKYHKFGNIYSNTNDLLEAIDKYGTK